MSTTIPEPSQKELSTYKALATRKLNEAEDFKVESQADYEKANDWLVTVKKAKREVNDKKRGILDPINLAAKRTRELFHQPEDMLLAAENVIKASMLDYRSKIEREEAEKARKLQAEVDAGKKSEEEAVDQIAQSEAPEKTTHSNKGRTTLRETLGVRVVDEAKVPREFLTLDMVKIRNHALGRNGLPKREIPGVETYVEKNIV